jgi:ABC-type Zn2+ transport system substrate-binding protein/surface adhesin
LLDSAFIAVIVIGLLHGLEPAHGWPVAFMYSSRTHRPLFYGFVSSAIISLAHFTSSIAAAVIYVLVSSLVVFPSQIMKYLAAAALMLLALKFYFEKTEDESQHGHLHENTEAIEHEHEHEHPEMGRHTHWHKHSKPVKLTLFGIAVFAFVLGFVHEEEFALLALAVGGVNPLILMVCYAASVTAALIGVTLISIKAYQQVQVKIKRYEKYIPKINATVLVVMAIAFILGLS